MNNDIDMVKAIAFRKRIKYAGDIAEQLMLAGWDLHTAILALTLFLVFLAGRVRRS